MDNTLYVGLSHQAALQRQLDVVANNIANMNTTAFKRESVLFQQYVQEGAATPAQKGENEIAFVFDYGVARNYTPGSFITTGNSLDVAVTGRGFLMVEGDDGQPMYTRNGHLTMDEDGTLLTPSGRAVLDEDGAPIIVTAADRSLNIAKDGTISGQQGRVAKLAIVEFAPEDEQSLEKAGNSLFTTEAQPEPAFNAEVLQGMVEGSNVEPIKEMTTLMDISRAYQRTGKMLEKYHELQTRSMERLAKVQ